MIKLLSEIKEQLEAVEKNDCSDININYSYIDTVSKRKEYIISSFNSIFKKGKSNKFLLKKFGKNLYTNSFFELRKDKLYFIGLTGKLIIEEINNFYKLEDFVPTNYSDFALIHNTHNNSLYNKSETSIALLRTDFNYLRDENLQAIVLNNNREFVKTNKVLIIVENYKIFELESLIEYLLKFQIRLNSKEHYEILYGSGNKINSSKIINLLKSYKEIKYLGDFDDEGYNIFMRLKNNLNNLDYKDIEFILPKQNLIDKIQSDMKEEKISLCRTNEDVYIKNDILLSLLELKKAFQMQQEVFID